jgi:hypothetical protein
MATGKTTGRRGGTPADKDLAEKREERAEIISDANKQELADQKDTLAQAKKDDAPFVPKLDDAGAAEQQQASLDANTVDKKLADKGLDGPPVVAPVLEKSKGKLKLTHYSDSTFEYTPVKDKVRQGELSGIWVEGSGFPRGEVIIDVRRNDVGDHARMSTMTDPEGNFMVQLGLITGPGTWLVHAESLTTEVGEGREDGLPLIKETKPIELEVS